MGTKETWPSIWAAALGAFVGTFTLYSALGDISWIYSILGTFIGAFVGYHAPSIISGVRKTASEAKRENVSVLQYIRLQLRAVSDSWSKHPAYVRLQEIFTLSKKTRQELLVNSAVIFGVGLAWTALYVGIVEYWIGGFQEFQKLVSVSERDIVGLTVIAASVHLCIASALRSVDDFWKSELYDWLTRFGLVFSAVIWGPLVVALLFGIGIVWAIFRGVIYTLAGVVSVIWGTIYFVLTMAYKLSLLAATSRGYGLPALVATAVVFLSTWLWPADAASKPQTVMAACVNALVAGIFTIPVRLLVARAVAHFNLTTQGIKPLRWFVQPFRTVAPWWQELLPS